MIDLARVFTENYKLLFRIVYASVGNIEDTKDLLQDVFIRAYKAFRRDIPYDKILPWLIVIAKNRARTHLKKKTNIIPFDVNNIESSYETDFYGFVIEDALSEMISIIPEEFGTSTIL
jgi:RNA polymerase sigma factor (sigma-70 family)